MNTNEKGQSILQRLDDGGGESLHLERMQTDEDLKQRERRDGFCMQLSKKQNFLCLTCFVQLSEKRKGSWAVLQRCSDFI